MRADRNDYVDAVIRLDGDGYTPGGELFAGVTSAFGLRADLAGELLADHRARFPAACVLFPDAVETLAALRASGLTLGLITNGSVRMQRARLSVFAGGRTHICGPS
jgi:hypothetical protein